MIKKIFLKLKKIIICNTYGYFNHVKYMKHYNKLLRTMGVNIKGIGAKFIAKNAYFDGTDYKLISLGENVVISANVVLLTHDFSNVMALEYRKYNNAKQIIKSIEIGDNSFIGINTTILPGTKIGKNTIIGAGSVVKGNIPDGVVVVGNPAKIISSIDEYAKKFIKEIN